MRHSTAMGVERLTRREHEPVPAPLLVRQLDLVTGLNGPRRWLITPDRVAPPAPHVPASPSHPGERDVQIGR